MRLTNKEVHDLARRIITNQTYIAFSGDAVSLSFGFILGMAAENAKQSEIETWGAAYEDYDRAAPRSINGYPMFFSCRILHVNDVPRLLSELQRMEQALGVPS